MGEGAAFQYPLLGKERRSESVLSGPFQRLLYFETRRKAWLYIGSIAEVGWRCIAELKSIEPSINPCTGLHIRRKDSRDETKRKVEWPHLQPIRPKLPACFSNHESKMRLRVKSPYRVKINSL